MSICRICGSSSLRAFEAREMTLGTREIFVYEHCAACGTRQLADPPRDLSGLSGRYPPRYFDFAPPAIPTETVRWLERFAQRPFRSVLDVGCATGALPAQLARMGITAVGVEPYAPVAPPRGWTLVRSLDDVAGVFDLVLASNVLEHALDVRAMLRAFVRHLAPAGRAIVMMPFGCSPLAQKYGAAWIGLEPGRHLHVLTRRTFVELAREVGLEVLGTQDQTPALNILMSRAWTAGVSWVELAARLAAQRLSPTLADSYEREAAAVRRAGQGDNWAYALRRRQDP